MASFFFFSQGEEGFEEAREIFLDVGDYHVLQGGVGSYNLDIGVEQAQDYRKGGPRVDQLVFNLTGHIKRVTGHHDATGPQRSIIGQHDLGAIGQIQRYPVPLLKAGIL